MTSVTLPQVRLPATAKLTVSFPEGRPAHSWYTVLTAAGGLSGAEWTFDLPNRVTAQLTDTEIKVKVQGGVVLVFR